MDRITMEDIMQWLEAQRTEANALLAALGDGDESHAEHSPEGKAVRIINAIVKRIGEMTAVEYLIEMRNIHRTYCDNGSFSCGDCPLLVDDNDHECAWDNVMKNPHNVVEIVKKWKEEQDCR